ncbi:MAG: hypothetical protein OIN87_05985 [Candidatus Methanoperedens sp.]|nr:hypothetical protein [Candidatus Methanoperedens sp.]
MSACQPINYNNVTPEVFACMKKKLGDAGINVPPGNSGEMQGSGVKAHFEWDGRSNLKIIVTDKPFIVRCGYVLSKITDLVQKCYGNL